MKLKKLLALALAGVLLTASLTACTPLDAAELVYDSIFGGGSSSTGSTGSTGSAAEDAENSAVAEGVADHFKGNSQNVEVSYSVPELTSTIRPAFTPEWFKKDTEGNISGLNKDSYINPSQTLGQFLLNSLKDYEEQSNYVGFFAFDCVAWLFGGQLAAVSRVIYALVGLAGLWCITLLFRERDGEE